MAAWPLVCEQQRLPRKVFRRSIAWLSNSLSTLRRLGYPIRRKTRFQPLVRRYWTGFHPQGSNERFQRASLHLILLPQTLLGAITSTEAKNGRWNVGDTSECEGFMSLIFLVPGLLVIKTLADLLIAANEHIN